MDVCICPVGCLSLEKINRDSQLGKFFSLPSQRNFPVSFKPRVAIAKLIGKMQKKTPRQLVKRNSKYSLLHPISHHLWYTSSVDTYSLPEPLFTKNCCDSHHIPSWITQRNSTIWRVFSSLWFPSRTRTCAVCDSAWKSSNAIRTSEQHNGRNHH